MLDAVADHVLTTREPVASHSRCGSRWICCQTHPQAERWADTNLRRQGFVTFLPLVIVTRRDRVTRSMTRQVEAPLFRGYIFVANADHWPPIQHTRGIARVLMCDGKPGYVNAGAVEAVQAAVALAAATTHPEELWRPGTPCSLRNGPFARHPAIVTSAEGENATIALMMLGALRQVSVHTDCLISRDEADLEV